MNSVDRILGEADKIYTNPKVATDVAIGKNKRLPKSEPYIAKDPQSAYRYAVHILHDRWPEAEEAMANSEYKDWYLKTFPEAKDDWILNGWLDWLDT
jgi:hypothetical protein